MEALELKAPKGKYRVIGVDTFSNEDWIYGDYDSLKEARELAEKKGGNMLKTYVYNSNGTCLFGFGTY